MTLGTETGNVLVLLFVISSAYAPDSLPSHLVRDISCVAISFLSMIYHFFLHLVTSKTIFTVSSPLPPHLSSELSSSQGIAVLSTCLHKAQIQKFKKMFIEVECILNSVYIMSIQCDTFSQIEQTCPACV